MVGALWTGISGLRGSQMGLDNESNNIANVNTIGYKSARISFTDQMYQEKIGKGVTSFDVEKMYTQGSLKRTGVSYDMALSGDGFFVSSNGRETFYTRAGNFRMGESGTLEDVGANKIQGWAMQPLKSDDIMSTDPNASYFTEDFNKVLGNKIIRDTTTIETITAKATDYTATATSDSETVFTGAGYKSASTKIADVEMLITEYNKLLTTHSEADPKPTASTSSVQKSYMDFNLDNPAVELDVGDELYVYIDGTKYSQTFDTDERTTLNKFIDKLSNTPGFKAHYTKGTPYNYTNPASSNPEGGVYLESLIPGKQFRITEFGWTDASNSNQATKGDPITIAEAVQGTGMGAIKSVEEALAQAVSGKQMDVYTPNELKFSDDNTLNDVTYRINIYDKELETNVNVPTSGALQINDATGIDDVITAINADSELSKYVKAYNINGNMVIKTLDKNNDVEFTGKLTSTTATEEMLVSITGNADADDWEFLGHQVKDAANGDTPNQQIARILADKDAIIKAWNDDKDPNQQIQDITAAGTTITITYKQLTKDSGGTTLDVDDLDNNDFEHLGTHSFTEKTKGGSIYDVIKNINYSTREGAGAEFLKINTVINQTASQGDLQLRLDTLGITDSAFGEFRVDDTGLIVMKQSGVDFAIGQIGIARFTDNRGLEPVGDNLYKATTKSGNALYKLNNYETAAVKGGSLELSTSDLSESLVNLMVFQRAFEANAKSITTADQILTTLIQLKR